MNKTILAAVLIVLTAFTVLSQEPVEIGSFVRRAMFIPLYEAKFYGPSADEIIREFPLPLNMENITVLAEHILSAENEYSLRLEIRTIINLKDYEIEFENFIACLQRAGFMVDDNFTISENIEVRTDILAYADFLFGIERGRTNSAWDLRRTGDLFILSSNPERSRVTYVPRNNPSDSRTITFTDPTVIRGIISTYLNPENCSTELRPALPEALLSSYLCNN
ncbi:MAG: hypothetical protein ACLFR1_04360 [Spirochaetia bacterium]